MATLKSFVQIDLKGNLQEQTRRNSEAMKRFGRDSNSALSGISAGVGNWAKSLGAITAGYLSINAAMGAVQKFATVEQRYARLAVSGRMTLETMEGLKKSIRDTAALPEIQIKNEELLAAIEEIIEKTGDLKFARENIRALALTISATSSSGKEIGGMVSTALKLGIRDPQEILRFISTFIEQGKEAAFPLAKIATKGEKVLSAAAGSGQKGERGAADTGALLQIAQMGTGDSDTAAVAFTNVITDLTKSENQKKFKGLGVKVFEDEKNKILRPIPDILAETIKATNGDLIKLNDIFGEQSRYITNVLNTTVKNQEGIEESGIAVMERLRKMRGEEALIVKDSQFMAATTQAVLDRVDSIEEEAIDKAGLKIKGDIKGKTGLERQHALWVATPINIAYGVRDWWNRTENQVLDESPSAIVPAPAPAPSPAAPQRVAVDIKVNQDGKVKEVKVKGAGGGSAQIMRGARVPQ